MVNRVFLDANVMASRTCLDWLFHLRDENSSMFQLHSTPDVIAEATRVMRKRNPYYSGGLITDYLIKIGECLDEIIPDFSEKERFSGTDEGDYHVHAAALKCQANLILTDNAPTDITTTPDKEPYEIITADNFFMLVVDSNPYCLVPVTQEQFDYWSNKRGSLPLDEALKKSNCPQFAKSVREALKEVALL